MGTMTFQQKHKLRSSSHPPELLISSDTNPSWGATVIWPQTPAKPHRLLNNRLAAVLVHLLKVKLSIFLQGRPRAVPKPGAEAELSHFCSAQPWSGRSSHHWPQDSSSSARPRAGKWKRNSTVSARRHCLMRTATSCLPQELLDCCLPRSQCLGNYSDFHFRL